MQDQGAEMDPQERMVSQGLPQKEETQAILESMVNQVEKEIEDPGGPEVKMASMDSLEKMVRNLLGMDYIFDTYL